MAENKNEIPTLGEITAHEQANLDAFIDMLSTMSEIDFEAVRNVYKRGMDLDTTSEDSRKVFNETLGTIEIIEGARRRIEASNQ